MFTNTSSTSNTSTPRQPRLGKCTNTPIAKPKESLTVVPPTSVEFPLDMVDPDLEYLILLTADLVNWEKTEFSPEDPQDETTKTSVTVSPGKNENSPRYPSPDFTSPDFKDLDIRTSSTDIPLKLTSLPTDGGNASMTSPRRPSTIGRNRIKQDPGGKTGALATQREKVLRSSFGLEKLQILTSSRADDHSPKLTLPSAAKNFLEKAFSATSTEKAMLLLEVVKQAEKESGNKDDWVLRAVKALTSAAKPEALFKVCWLHGSLVSALNPDQKSKLETLLFALQTFLRNASTFDERKACWDKIAETAKSEHRKKYSALDAQIIGVDQELDACVQRLGKDPFHSNDQTVQEVLHIWDAAEAGSTLRSNLVSFLLRSANWVADAIEGFPLFPLNDVDLAMELLTEKQLAIVLEGMKPLFSILFSARTATNLSPTSIELMKIIHDKINKSDLEGSATSVFFLKFIGSVFADVLKLADANNSQGALIKETAFMRFFVRLLQDFANNPEKPSDLGLTAECAKVLNKWLDQFKPGFKAFVIASGILLSGPAEACMTAALNKSSSLEILRLLGPLIARAKVDQSDLDWPKRAAEALASKGETEGLHHVCSLLTALCFHARSESESARHDVVLLVRAIEDYLEKATPKVADNPCK